MVNKIFRQVLCSERLPKETEWYFTNEGHIKYYVDRDYFASAYKVDWWLEEVELPSEPKMALMAFECEDKYKEKEENANPYIVFLEGFTKAIELIKGEGLNNG